MIDLQHVARRKIAPPTWIRAYSSPFSTPARPPGVIAFPRQVPEGPQGPQPGLPPMDAIITLRGLPAMLAVGMRDTALLPEYVIPAFKLSYPDAPVVEIPDAGQFPAEDAPQDSAGTAQTVPANDACAHLNPSSDYNSPQPDGEHTNDGT